MSHYEEWTDDQLKEECVRRGLKAGSKDALVARLEMADELPLLSLKRKREEELAELDGALRIACGEGSLEDVLAALSSGANVNAPDDERHTSLVLAATGPLLRPL
jgi:hypothetical protein